MRVFIKYFAIAFLLQLAITTVFFFFDTTKGIAEFIVYTFYILPYTFIIPKDSNGIGAAGYTFFILLIIPPIIYSAIFGLIISGLSAIRNKYQ